MLNVKQPVLVVLTGERKLLPFHSQWISTPSCGLIQNWVLGGVTCQ